MYCRGCGQPIEGRKHFHAECLRKSKAERLANVRERERARIASRLAKIVCPHCQVVKEKRKLPEISIPGRTAAAINGYRTFLREKGLLEARLPLRNQQYWTTQEIRALKNLVTNLHFSSRSIAKKGLLRGRSVDSISQMMRRLHLTADRKHSRVMKSARRLSPAELKKLKAYLLGPGRKAPCKKVCKQFNISHHAVNRHRKLLGASLTWSEARRGMRRSP
jgi:hypothetical protein